MAKLKGHETMVVSAGMVSFAIIENPDGTACVIDKIIGVLQSEYLS